MLANIAADPEGFKEKCKKSGGCWDWVKESPSLETGY